MARLEAEIAWCERIAARLEGGGASCSDGEAVEHWRRATRRAPTSGAGRADDDEK